MVLGTIISVYLCVCVCGLSRQCQGIPRVILNITPRYINYKGNTRTSEDIDICNLHENPYQYYFGMNSSEHLNNLTFH